MFVCCIIVQTGRHLFEKTIPFKNSGAETIYDSLTGRASGENFTAETSITPIPCESKEGPISLIPTIYFKDTIVPIPRSFIRNHTTRQKINVRKVA